MPALPYCVYRQRSQLRRHPEPSPHPRISNRNPRTPATGADAVSKRHAACPSAGENQFDKILADKNHEIAALSNQINAYEKDSKLAAAEIEGRLKAQIAEQDKLIAELKAQAKSLETAKNMEKELEITKAVAE